jgi:ubiquitin conjugation factor E4 B
LSADEAEAKKWSEEGGGASCSACQQAPLLTLDAADFAAPPNFITEIYYITLRLSSLGMSKALRNFNERAEELHRMKKRADEYEADRGTWSSDPNAAQYEAFIKKARAECQRSEAIMAATETQLLEPSYIDRVLTFTSFVMTWLVRMADPLEQHPQKEVQLPLPKEVPERFRMLPEHIFEDVCETLIFLGR